MVVGRTAAAVARLLKKGFGTLRQACPEHRRRAQGERETVMRSGRDPLMLSPSKHGVGFFSSLVGRRR